MKEFYDDVKEKSQIARSAKYKGSGGRRKRVSFPSDHLSYAAKRKLNGSVSVYKIGEKISWAEFRSYPEDIQKEYLQYFADRFQISNMYFAEMLGTTGACVATYFNKYRPNLTGILPRRTPKPKIHEFHAWLNESKESEKQPPKVIEKQPQKEKEQVVSYFAHTLRNGTLMLEGTGAEIAQTLFGMFQNEQLSIELKFVNCTVTPVEVEDEDEIVEVEDEDEIVEDEGMLNVNTASFQQLRFVGFSDNITANIISKRPFASIEELKSMPYVKDIFPKVRNKICVR